MENFNLSKKHIIIAVSLFLGIIFLNSILWYAKPGHQYYLATPTGHRYTVMNSGLHFCMPTTRIQEWEKYVDIKVIHKGESSAGIEGKMTPIPIRFIDQVKATVAISVRMQIPSDPVSFMQLAEEFRHPDNLVKNTLVPTVKEQVINTGYMFTAQDYISGSASDFRQSLGDQLKNGGYSVEKKEIFDTLYLNQDIQQDGQRKINEINTKYMVSIREKDGKPVRIPHDITKNKISVTQVIVDELVLEPAFQARLEKQRDIASTKRIEMEAIEAAKIGQQKIVAEGEKEKAAERAKREREQVATLIEIETKVKEEKSKKELALIALETAKLEAQAERVRADAESYKNQKLVNAGLAPLERATIEKETRIGVAAEIAKTKFPEIYISGTGGSSGGILESLIGAELAKQTLKPSAK